MKKGLLRSIATVGSLTLVSRVLGLVRDIVIGTVFGSGAATDAFFVAFKIPNFMRRLFAEGAFSQAFVPVLTEYKETRPEQQARRLVAETAGALGMVLLLVTALGIVFSPWVVRLFAPGFMDDPDRFDLAVTMLRWTFSYLLFISLTACAGGVLNTYGRFGPPAFAPVLLNLVMIAAALWGAQYATQPIVALAVGVFIAGIAQLAMLLPYLARLRMLSWPRVNWSDPGVRRILRLMGPAVFGSSVAQINLLLDTVLASFLITGSVSWLYFSDRLVEFPLGVFGVALGTVILPRLASEHATASPAQFARTLDWALRWVLLISVPATVGLVMLALPMLSTLFLHGAFKQQDVLAASMSLSTYGLGLAGFMLVRVLAPGYFARQDTRTPVRFAVISMVVNMVLSVVVVLALRHTGVGHAALALVTAIAATVNAAMLFTGLRRLGVYRPEDGWSRLARQVGVATLLMGLVLYWPATQTELWLNGGLWLRVGALCATVLVGVAVYFGSLTVQGLRWRSLREPMRVLQA
jgi:putative peptidoglycan lipid II flippase